jgi:pSer/pThr/pTyr-binding forkhead associated (FHA) protein
MEFSFETQGANTYLVYHLSADDVIDSVSLGMLSNNKIRGLAPVLFTRMDEHRYLKYNVSAKIPAGKFFTGEVTKKRLLGVFGGVADAIAEAGDYMLDASKLILGREYIFTDVTTYETLMICLPIDNSGNPAPDIQAFFKEILFGSQYAPGEDNKYVAELISLLNGAAAFSLADFGAAVKRLQSETERAPAPAEPRYIPAPQYIPPPPVVSEPPPTPAVSPAPARADSQPVYAPPPAPPARQQEREWAPRAEEKSISLVQLLLHYSKENKALYNAQKAKKAIKAIKAEGGTPRRAKPDIEPESKRAPRQIKNAQAAPNAGFAVPGVEAEPVKQGEAPEPRARAYAEPVRTAAPRPRQAPVQAYQTAAGPDAPAPRRQVSFGETVVLNAAAAGSTEDLDGGRLDAPYLIRSRSNEKINLTAPVFRIGKERSFVDYFIGDYTAVSRSLAVFTARGGEYFVADMNSTNHTYLNGEMIRSGVEMKLEHGSKIRLANEEFEFRLY